MGFILKPIGLLFGLLDRPIARRNERQLRLDIAEAMPSLFSEYGGRVVPNEGVPFPPSFDYAFVTVAVGNFLIRFCRGRGELDLARRFRNSPSRFTRTRPCLGPRRQAGGSQTLEYREPAPRCAGAGAFSSVRSVGMVWTRILCGAWERLRRATESQFGRPSGRSISVSGEPPVPPQDAPRLW